jgi:hypothetical protein
MTEQSSTPRGARSTYASARNLPSFREMAQFVQGAKVLTRVVARDQRQTVRDIEHEMKRLADVVDGFYARLGDRNWIFHELLNPSTIEVILAETSDPAETELRLVELYQDRDVMRFWLTQLRQHEGFRARERQIKRAAEHYYANHFSSCTLQLIAVMDGFVNDFEPESRKGLAAREPDEMAAWDSVVGHHQRLTNVMKTFRKTIKKRIDDGAFRGLPPRPRSRHGRQLRQRRRSDQVMEHALCRCRLGDGHSQGSRARRAQAHMGRHSVDARTAIRAQT